jgi:hypothetical protein
MGDANETFSELGDRQVEEDDLERLQLAMAGQRIRLLVVVGESGSKLAHTKATSPAGDLRNLRWVVCL